MRMADESKTKLKKLVAEKQKDIDTLSRLMSNCYDDEAYRDYSRNQRQCIQEKLALEKRLRSHNHE